MRLLPALSIFFFYISNLLVTKVVGHAPNGTVPRVPATIVFGDSIMDPGNNNDLKTIVKCNFPPYGMNFIGHQPTGRFCNGLIPTDLIASRLGIKPLLPAYVGTTLSPEDLLTGVSFASGASGFDPLTSKVASVLSMSDQLDLFKDYQAKVRSIAGEERASNILSQSLYVVCAGSDDIANTYFGTPFRRAHYDIPSYVNLMLRSASSFVEDLVNLGAKKIGFISAPPIGCVPSQRTLDGGILRGCAGDHNIMATMFNSAMEIELQRLSAKYPGTRLIPVDIYTPLLDIMEHPNSYGFEVATKGCCGTGDLEVSVLCNSATSLVCADVSKYVFWDSYHPTQRTYEILVDYIYNRYIHELLG